MECKNPKVTGVTHPEHGYLTGYCDAEGKEIQCQEDGCSHNATVEWEADNDDFHYYCDKHAAESGICVGCHYMCAGSSSWTDGSYLCSDCMEGIGGYDDDGDYDYSYGEYYYGAPYIPEYIPPGEYDC